MDKPLVSSTTQRRYEEVAARLAGAIDPSGLGRPMKAWVVVPLAQSGEWERLAQLALAASDT